MNFPSTATPAGALVDPVEISASLTLLEAPSSVSVPIAPLPEFAQ